MKEFSGLGTALVTPFFPDGTIDYEAYKMSVKRQADAGVDFLVALGTTAETPCLADEEKIRLLECTREVYKGKLVVGIGTNSLQGVFRNMKKLEDKGADAWLVVTPYYNKPMQNGLFRFYSAIASQSTLPVILYNVPGRTGVNMEPETVAELSKIRNIIGLKEANPDHKQCKRVKELVGDEFVLLSGNDDKWIELAEMGYDGLISVVSNIIPEKMVELGQNISNKDFEKARSLNNILQPLFKTCFSESNPIPVKAALSLLGICNAEMRLPLTEASNETKRLLAEAIKMIKERTHL